MLVTVFLHFKQQQNTKALDKIPFIIECDEKGIQKSRTGLTGDVFISRKC